MEEKNTANKKPLFRYGDTAPAIGVVYLRSADNRRLVVTDIESTVHQGKSMWLRVHLFDCAENVTRILAWHEWYDAMEKKQLEIITPATRPTQEASNINLKWASGEGHLIVYTDLHARPVNS